MATCFLNRIRCRLNTMKKIKIRKEKYGKSTIYRNDWFEFCTGWKKLNLKVAPASYFDNRAMLSFSLGWGQFYIHIPFIRSKYDECDPPQYGFYLYSNDSLFPTSLVFCLGKKTHWKTVPKGFPILVEELIRGNRRFKPRCVKEAKN